LSACYRERRHGVNVLRAAAALAADGDAAGADELLGLVETKLAALFGADYRGDLRPDLADGLIDAYVARGRLDEALAVARDAGGGAGPEASARLGVALARAGRVGEALELVARDLGRATGRSTCVALAPALLAASHVEGTLAATVEAMTEACAASDRALGALVPEG
jgi:hypothetical protein